MNDFLINTTTAGIQSNPSVAALGTSLYFVVWSDTSDAAIKGRLFRTDGTPATGEFPVSEPDPAAPNTLREQPVIAANPLTGAFVAWVERPSSIPGPRPHVKMRRFDRDGHPLGGVEQISSADIDPESGPAVTHLIDAGFLVAWVNAAPDRRILARRYAFDGTPQGPEFPVSATTGFHTGPFAARLDGNCVIGWRSDPSLLAGGAITLRVLTFDGAAVTGETVPRLSGFAGGGKAVAALPNEQFVIAHERVSPDRSRTSVETNVLAKDGDLAEPGVPACSGPGLSCTDPALAPLAGSCFLAAWVQKDAATGEGHAVMAKVISTTHGSLDAPMQLSAQDPGERFDVAAATVPDPAAGQSAFIAWTDLSATDTGPCVRGRVLRIPDEGPPA
ncbi:hypothetical protein RM780_24155 [Streptomyces sp. DSM 44917]|uniref:Uncharacterized protein n=1 Tax=Streptomyces boetiae TaxID=3075541 RepID=A0ABU2LEK6_9ACTN|nr:hypothetical protein [Streptomyces sp. DSM 44917]MDT0310024.1 hypothetical protein [Streptomyces sp. DSM 44917]